MRRTYMSLVILTLFLFSGNFVLANDVNKEGFNIKAFGGVLAIPQGFTMDVSQWPEKFIRFNNLALNSKIEGESKTSIRIGIPDEELKIFILKASFKRDCYGFKQAELRINIDNKNTYVSYFYDEYIYISIVSNDKLFWRNTIKYFAEQSMKVAQGCPDFK